MNILFICDEYPPGLNGGIGSIVQSLSREMQRQGHRVYVIGLYTYQYGEADYEVDNGVRIWRLRYGFNFGKNKILYKFQRKIPSFIKSGLFGRSDFKRFVGFVCKIIQEESIDIIEQPDWNTFAYEIGISNPVLPKLSIPLILKSHGSHSYFSKELNLPIRQKWRDIDKALFARADAISFVSKYCFEQNKLLFDIHVPTQILYNALPQNADQVKSERSGNIVFFSGTLVQKKGIFSLIKAWNIVNALVPDAKLIVFGKGETKALEDLLDNRARNSVDFKGHCPRKVLDGYLSLATLSIFPSYSETFGLGAVESMSCGCPTIFTKRSCGPEIIQHQENGLLVDPDDIQEIADTIMLLLSNKSLRERLGARGQIDVENRFNLTNITQKHILWYKEVISSFEL